MNNFVLSEIFRSRRGVADLKSAGRKAVGVQVPLWAPNNYSAYMVDKLITYYRIANSILDAVKGCGAVRLDAGDT